MEKEDKKSIPGGIRTSWLLPPNVVNLSSGNTYIAPKYKSTECGLVELFILNFSGTILFLFSFCASLRSNGVSGNI